MNLTKVQITLNVYITSFKRLLKDTIGIFFLKGWKPVMKEDVGFVDNTMLPEILRIQSEGFELKNRNGIRRYSKKLQKTFYVIKFHDKVVGYCIYYIKLLPSIKGFKKDSVIYSIAIDKNFRRKGFGERLLRESLKEMKLNNISTVTLYVNIKNLPAISLYEKIGFKAIGEIKNICGQNEICHEMKLKLA